MADETTTQTMVQIVAKVLAADEYGEDATYLGEPLWKNYTDLAAAVLTAIRKPTEAMIEAGFNTGAFENDAAFAEPRMAATVFTAMIDKAISELRVRSDV